MTCNNQGAIQTCCQQWGAISFSGDLTVMAPTERGELVSIPMANSELHQRIMHIRTMAGRQLPTSVRALRAGAGLARIGLPPTPTGLAGRRAQLGRAVKGARCLSRGGPGACPRGDRHRQTVNRSWRRAVCLSRWDRHPLTGYQRPSGADPPCRRCQPHRDRRPAVARGASAATAPSASPAPARRGPRRQQPDRPRQALKAICLRVGRGRAQAVDVVDAIVGKNSSNPAR